MNKNKLNIRINKVYTRTGDKGKTHLIGGIRAWKDDPRIGAYGTIDELNAVIGMCIELIKETKEPKLLSLDKILISIQNELFNLGTQIGATKDMNNLPKLSKDAISKLENEIDRINSSLSDLSSFVLPGGNIINAQLHIARTVCRRAERQTVSLSKISDVKDENIIYLNRLSDVFFVWSRWVSKILNSKENLWKPNH